MNKEVARPSEQARDKVLQEDFWKISAEMA